MNGMAMRKTRGAPLAVLWEVDALAYDLWRFRHVVSPAQDTIQNKDLLTRHNKQLPAIPQPNAHCAQECLFVKPVPCKKLAKNTSANLLHRKQSGDISPSLRSIGRSIAPHPTFCDILFAPRPTQRSNLTHSVFHPFRVISCTFRARAACSTGDDHHIPWRSSTRASAACDSGLEFAFRLKCK